MLLQVARLVAVLALLCAAAAIATPKGRLPLALRGLAKTLRKCEGETVRGCEGEDPLVRPPSCPSAGKRLLAFSLVVLAILLAVI